MGKRNKGRGRANARSRGQRGAGGGSRRGDRGENRETQRADHRSDDRSRSPDRSNRGRFGRVASRDSRRDYQDGFRRDDRHRDGRSRSTYRADHRRDDRSRSPARSDRGRFGQEASRDFRRDNEVGPRRDDRRRDGRSRSPYRSGQVRFGRDASRDSRRDNRFQRDSSPRGGHRTDRDRQASEDGRTVARRDNRDQMRPHAAAAPIEQLPRDGIDTVLSTGPRGVTVRQQPAAGALVVVADPNVPFPAATEGVRRISEVAEYRRSDRAQMHRDIDAWYDSVRAGEYLDVSWWQTPTGRLAISWQRRDVLGGQ